MRYSPLDDCSERFTDCPHNRSQTHYHCIQDGCDKVSDQKYSFLLFNWQNWQGGMLSGNLCTSQLQTTATWLLIVKDSVHTYIFLLPRCNARNCVFRDASEITDTRLFIYAWGKRAQCNTKPRSRWKKQDWHHIFHRSTSQPRTCKCTRITIARTRLSSRKVSNASGPRRAVPLLIASSLDREQPTSIVEDRGVLILSRIRLIWVCRSINK